MKILDKLAALFNSKQDGIIRVDGVVKWFNTTSGYGFATCPSAEKDVFLHISCFRGYPVLMNRPAVGKRISFVVEKTDRGYRAKDVVVI